MSNVVIAEDGGVYLTPAGYAEVSGGFQARVCGFIKVGTNEPLIAADTAEQWLREDNPIKWEMITCSGYSMATYLVEVYHHCQGKVVMPRGYGDILS